MRKGYYIHFQGRESIGVSKKIDMQMEELRKYYDMRELEIRTPDRSLPERIFGLLPIMSIRRNYDEALEQLDDPDFLYVRRTVADRAYLRFWKKVKERYPDCKIVIEIFSYPYDKDDFGKWNAWPFYLKELLYRPKLRRYVDRFVTYTEDEEIFGVPTIRSTNGINIDRIRRIRGEFQEGSIRLIGVAFMQRHHGYERLIEGLRQYYQRHQQPEYQIYMHLVGDGPEKPFYQELVQRYGLENFVKFYPTMSGQELDDLYDQCDIALASFGMYKAGFHGKMSALKTRECLAKGMPLLTGCAIDVLDETYPYARLFPNNGSVVDGDEIVAFYQKLRLLTVDKQEMADRIRSFAVAHVSMEAVMKPIIEYVK
ncbi:MAG: glycosyltransferase [Clostridiales bacterium]|nr:glycosyltransferase [Clostridiales bacterium]